MMSGNSVDVEAQALALIGEAFTPPDGIPAADWGAVEAEIGVPLPASYKALCDAYGDSVLETSEGVLQLMAPQANRRDSRFPEAALGEIKMMARHIAEQSQSSGEAAGGAPSTPFFPEPGGLLPWAREGGRLIYYAVEAAVPPDAWRVVAPKKYVADPPVPDGEPGTATFIVGHLGLDRGAVPVAFVEPDPGPLSAESATGAPSTAEPRSAPAPAPVAETWKRIEAVLTARSVPLRDGATDEAVADLEARLGVSLPEALRASLKLHDGLDRSAHMFLHGGDLCSTEALLIRWRSMTGMQHDGSFDGFEIDAEPDPEIRDDVWWRDGWLPVVTRDGDFLVLDLDPAPTGTLGQVFSHDRLDGPGRLAAPDFASWLQLWAEALEALPPDEPALDAEEAPWHDPASPVWPL